MCSFLITSWIIQNLAYVNFFMQRRGPDVTNHVRKRGYTFVHNLLHMTGEKRLQPFSYYDDYLHILFNGEIYNFAEIGHSLEADRELARLAKVGPEHPEYADARKREELIRSGQKNLNRMVTDGESILPLYVKHG